MFAFTAPAIRPEDGGDCLLRSGRDRCLEDSELEERGQSGKATDWRSRTGTIRGFYWLQPGRIERRRQRDAWGAAKN